MKSSPLMPTVTTIIPTAAWPERATLLRRAVASVRKSSLDSVQIIAVVNGPRFDPDVCAWLKAQPDVIFEYCEEPSSPNAVRRGREMVKTPYFSMLDDDDEYLEGGTDMKLRALTARPDGNLLVSNGYTNLNNEDKIRLSRLADAPSRPLDALFEANWLLSCNALYRTDSVGVEYFENSHPYAEWTWLAFRLALDHKTIIALDEPTFRIHDTEDSLSKSDKYASAYIPLFKRMLALHPHHQIQRLLQTKLGDALHDKSSRALERGDWLEAFKSHTASLVRPGGIKYILYSRKILISLFGPKK